MEWNFQQRPDANRQAAKTYMRYMSLYLYGETLRSRASKTSKPCTRHDTFECGCLWLGSGKLAVVVSDRKTATRTSQISRFRIPTAARHATWA